jgi:cobalamin synthase
LSRSSVFFSLDFTFHEDSFFINSLKNSLNVYFIIKVLLFPLLFLTKKVLSKLQKQLGFLNGDTIGFNIEVSEIVLLNSFIAFI